MPQQYADVITRTLTRAERRVPIQEQETPLVIEPLQSSDMAFLEEFLQHHSPQVQTDLATHGAVLLRGFAAETPGDFERAMLSIRGMRGVKEILLSEPGRALVDGTQFVFYTNTLSKSGGTLNFGVFHTENYFIPEVPRYIAFFCEVPGRLGGETGLLNVAKLYTALPDGLKRKLEDKACLAGFYAVVDIAARYGVTAELVEEFCKDVSLPLTDIDGQPHVAIFKPSVIEHPLTRERSLQLHFSVVPGLNEPLRRAFLPDYSGLQWLAHRASWKHPWLVSWSMRRALRKIHRAEKEGKGSHTKPPEENALGAHTAKSLFTPEEVQILAPCMRRHYSSFPWRRGDILILDNLKIAHSGMAGIGKRELKVIMCNPLLLSEPATSPGLRVIPSTLESSDEGLRSRLSRLRNGHGAEH